MVKNLPASVGDSDLIPGSERSPGEGSDNHSSVLAGKSHGRRSLAATVHGVEKNWIRRKWQPTPIPLPGKFHGWRSLVGYSPWGHKESDTTEQLRFTHLLTNNIKLL